MQEVFANPKAIPQSAPPPIAGSAFFQDLDNLRIGPEADFLAGATKAIRTVDVGKPKPNVWFRTDPKRSLTTTVYEDKETRQFFLVTKGMAPKLRELGALTVATLVPYINRAKDVAIWPVKLGMDGMGGSLWHATAADAVRAASDQWTRIFADMSLGGYRIQVPIAEWSEPAWPEEDLSQLLELGFKKRVIDSDDHPVMNQLLGRI